MRRPRVRLGRIPASLRVAVLGRRNHASGSKLRLEWTSSSLLKKGTGSEHTHLVIVHEAFHTFTYIHSGSDTFPADDALANGDVVRPGSDRDFPLTITRFNLPRIIDPPFPDPLIHNNYVRAVQVMGLRDDDEDGQLNWAYVTGTGLHDTIEITWLPAQSRVHVEVRPYLDAARTVPLTRPSEGVISESYTIDLATETETSLGNLIKIDCGRGSDHVIVSSLVPAGIEIRGGEGNDTADITIDGGLSILSWTFADE